MDKDQNRAEAFLSEAYDTEDHRSQLAFYAKWAADYDQQMVELQYSSPRILCDLILQYLPNSQANILDVGCGTGLTVKALFEVGYTDIHGLDLSQDMINVASRRDFYQSLNVADVKQPLEYPDAQFDAVISSGTFTHGHVGAEPLNELLRILKPDGILACTVHQDLWQAKGFEASFSNFEQTDQMHCLYRELNHLFDNKPPEGWFCVYRKV